ncbi:FAD-binding oxidoreductase [Solwaraspora sp. WMMD791]|uniref:FAD-binding oxidoreductase n=1 Tax=Solwaraspora sp. WMMD791 TaxID=3016086 RepID=UPI00249CEC24|nr:FAD-binding oxidoreductase [Solwaraspora sp. WMMD791]WFE26125.1 FAD-binding oxidoreductase [Solwaraspora sp. WMMD791]
MSFDDRLAELLTGLDGSVLRPGMDGYDDEVTGFQTGLRHQSAIVVRARGATDVCAAVRAAAALDLPVAVQATGHGLTVPDEGGVLVSTRRMDAVEVDPESGLARIGPGARWDQVVAAAEPHGLVPPSGSAGHVGVAGYTLAGGIGLLAREFGYAADHVRALDVVTADGELRRVDAEDVDLFWAIRGGRDNFGVVTRIEIALAPVGSIYGGGIYFDSVHAEALLSFFHSWTTRVPETITASLGMIGYPDLPAFPEPLRGRHVVHVRFATTDLAGGAELVRPWLDVAPPIVEHLGELPYRKAGSVYREPNFPHAYDGNSVLLEDLDPQDLLAVRELVGPAAEVPCIVDLRHLGGALARQPAVPNAVSFRSAQYILRVLSPLDGADATRVRELHEHLFERVAPRTLGRSLNFIYGRRNPTDLRSELYEPDILHRLVALKKVHDPANIFRRNQNLELA